MKQLGFFDDPETVITKPQHQVREVLCMYTQEKRLLDDIIGSANSEKLFTAFPGMQLLLNASAQELATVVNKQTAEKLIAIFNLSRQLPQLPHVIKKPEDAYQLLRPYATKDKEHFWVITLDVRLQVTGIHEMYKGSIDAISQIRISELLRPAVVMNAHGIILVHNHPSADPDPSPGDYQFTETFVRRARDIDIDTRDHIVIGNGFCSMRTRRPNIFN